MLWLVRCRKEAKKYGLTKWAYIWDAEATCRCLLGNLLHRCKQIWSFFNGCVIGLTTRVDGYPLGNTLQLH